MRLTDEEIQKSYIYPKEVDCRNTFVDGAEFARDFYENQKCINCEKKNTHYCRVREFMGMYDYMKFDNQSQDFGCTDWEEKK